MFLVFVYLMGYQPGRGLLLHGILGSTLLILFFVHHALNVRWYAGLGKGKYPPVRVFFLVIDFLLLAAMIGMAVSSMAVFDRSEMLSPNRVPPLLLNGRMILPEKSYSSRKV